MILLFFLIPGIREVFYNNIILYIIFFPMWRTFSAIQQTFCESEWKWIQSLDQITACLALQQLAGHGASLCLAAYFGVLDIRLLGNALHNDKNHNKSKMFHSESGQTTITLCILCVGVNVADVIPMIFFNTYFFEGNVEWACMFFSSSVPFHIHTPTHIQTSDLPAVNHQHYWPLNSSS